MSNEQSSVLKKKIERYGIILETTGDIIFEYHIDEDRMLFDEARLENGQYVHYPMVVERYIEALHLGNLVHPDDIEETIRLVNGLTADGIVIRVTRPDEHDGQYHWTLVRAATVRDDDGRVTEIVGIMRDIDDQKRREDRLIEESRCDKLTGLYDKKWTREKISEALAAGTKLDEGIMMLVDIDGFRAVNENLGHIFGDAVLVETAEKLTAHAAPGDVIGRIGGDEFLVYSPGVAENQIAERVTRIRRIFDHTFEGKNQSYRITCSLGVAACPRDGDTFESLFSCADQALSMAKMAGRDRWYRYDKKMSGRSYLTGHATNIDGTVFQKGGISAENRVLINIFEILADSKDLTSSMTLILGMIGRFIGVERVCVFVEEPESGELVNQYSWYSGTAICPKTERVGAEDHRRYREAYDEKGLYTLYSADTLPARERALFCERGVYSGIYKTLVENGRYLGCIGLSGSQNNRSWSEDEKEFVCLVSKIISANLYKFHLQKENAYESQVARTIVDSQSIKSHVVDAKTYKLLFVSASLKAERPAAKVGSLCYETVMGLDAPCPFCRLNELTQETPDLNWQRYVSGWNRWFNFQCHSLQWRGAGEAALIAMDDISNFVDNILYVDKLTGISTFSRFELDASEIFDHETGKEYAMVTFDIDEFRYINEFHGYSMGNQLLRYISGGLVVAMSGAEVCARVTGDVFVALMEWTGEGPLFKRLTQMVEGINKRLDYVIPGIRPSFQIGVYHAREGERDIGKMMDNADIARKSIKGSRKTGIAFYNKSMGEKILKTRQIEARMERALKDKEFLVYLQPKIDLESGRVVGAEALARWVDDRGNIVLPGEFIPVFESNGFIVELDFYVYEEVFKTHCYRQSRGLKRLPISMNMSRFHLKSGSYIERFRALAENYQVDPSLIEVEVTETIFIENSGYVKRLVSELRSDGFKVSIDDFGSGYSSLNLLSEIDVDVLKLDRSLCREENLSSKERVILKNIAAMAKELNLQVLAEGIETQNQAEFLRSIQCDSAQGFLFARPMPMDEFFKKLDGEW
ncbi:EAL domain-containing protein [Eubacterium sp. 1001713B170207_170306_E7]|uniref:bifunctional diguanylate cyclase/phosphodiesterase n=1 Tax=Eubacterium sp. 1001713B170207_170306_E7 TaxID=2787097 RepID=UPI001898CC28|nr:EAL domain-containing protein [Eubacterium sp. 1001713B170207_170306_E7]